MFDFRTSVGLILVLLPTIYFLGKDFLKRCLSV